MAQQWKHGWIPLTPAAVRKKNHGKKPSPGSKLGKLAASMKKPRSTPRRGKSGGRSTSSKAEARNQRIIAAAGGADPRRRSGTTGRKPFGMAFDPERDRARQQAAEETRRRDEESGDARYMEASRERGQAARAALDLDREYKNAVANEATAKAAEPNARAHRRIEGRKKRLERERDEAMTRLDAAERELADADAWRDAKAAMEARGLKGTLTGPRDLKPGDTFKLGGGGTEVTVLAEPRNVTAPDTSTGNGAVIWARREDTGKAGWLPIKGTQPQVVTGRKDIEPVTPPADKDPEARGSAASGTSRRERLRRG